MRTEVTEQDETAVLMASRRRCALCFGLYGDLTPKRGQIAHVDRNAANSVRSNLCFLCLPHHDEYDSTSNQSKRLTPAELRNYRKALYDHILGGRPLTDFDTGGAPITRPLLVLCYEPFRGHDGLTGIQWSMLQPLYLRNDGVSTAVNIRLDAAELDGRPVTSALGAGQLAPSQVTNVHLFYGGERVDYDLDRAFARVFERKITGDAVGRLTERIDISLAYDDTDLKSYGNRYEVVSAVHLTSEGRWQHEGVDVYLVRGDQ